MGNGQADRRREVVIFGAGIAGLTVAHELIERGFRVEVYEKAAPSLLDEIAGAPCAIGGMARTQWSRVERPPRHERPAPMRRTEPLQVSSRRKLSGLRIAYDEGSDPVADGRDTIRQVVDVLREDPTIRRIEVRGFTGNVEEALPYPNSAWNKRSDYLAARRVRDALADAITEAKVTDPELKIHVRDIYATPLGMGYPDEWAQKPERRSYIDFRVVEDLIPGEHGFRFFPSYYHHLHDTMRRTPIAHDRLAFRETGRTVLDNLLRTVIQRVSREPLPEENPDTGSARSFDVKRQPITSLREYTDYISGVMRSMDATPADIDRLNKRMFQYMTMCPERRAAECESLSWYEWVRGHEFSPAFQGSMDTTGQMLVSMTAKEADARSYGNSSVQLLIDQLRNEPKTDGTLSGPTSLAWFDHWRRYLERQGVEFRRGTLLRFEVVDDTTAWPVVEVEREQTDGEAPPIGGQPDDLVERVVVRDFVVVAVDLPAVRKILEDTEGKLVGEDVDRIRNFDAQDWNVAQPRGALRHMSGIQFYFDSDIPMVEGHTDYADSKWGLSSISQPQFWTERRGWWSGYRGVLSVDICNFHERGDKEVFKAVWECTPKEIADEVWAQIRAALTCAPEEVPDPIYYHLDDNLIFSGADEEEAEGAYASGSLRRNISPYLITLAGQYGRRPGSPRGYEVQHGNIVFAGTYMQTYTRITTMEAANESGRHAANAILKAGEFQGQRCQIFNPEERELPDLEPLVELDKRLYGANVPNVMDSGDLRRRPLMRAPDDEPTRPARPLLRRP